MATLRAPVTCLRAVRTVRARATIPRARFYATESSQATGSGGGFGQALTGGLVGGALVFAGGYTYYHFSGAKTLVQSSKQAKEYFDSATAKFKESTPEPNEALQQLRNYALSYAAFIPGAKGYVESAFKDLDAIRNKHGAKVDEIVKNTYNDLKAVSQDEGMSVEAATQAWAILEKRLKEIGELAGDAAEEILNNHPEVKDKVGGNIEQLKSLGRKYGPEAQKQVDQTWDQIKEIIQGGVSADSARKIQKLVQEKVEQIKKLGDKAWQKGMEEAKPYLDKSPKVKELVEKNANQLKQANPRELWDKVKEAAETGNTEPVEKYVKSVVDKAQK